MSAVATAVVGGTVLGAVVASERQGDATEKAAKEQRKASEKASNVEYKMFQEAMEAQKPFRKAGESALGRLRALAQEGGTQHMTELQNSLRALINQGPGEPDYSFQPSDYYNWRLEQGQQAIDKQLSAQGLLGSDFAVGQYADLSARLTGEETEKAFQRGLQEYQTELQGYQTKYGGLLDLYNMAAGRSDTAYNRLLQLANIGQGSAAQAAQTATATGRGLANIEMQRGQGLANAELQKGNAQANMWSSIGNAPMNAYSTYLMGQALK